MVGKANKVCNKLPIHDNHLVVCRGASIPYMYIYCHSPTQPKLNSTGVGLTTLLLCYPPR